MFTLSLINNSLDCTFVFIASTVFQAGHIVTVFERNDRCGGLLMYGIPSMKLNKQVRHLFII